MNKKSHNNTVEQLLIPHINEGVKTRALWRIISARRKGLTRLWGRGMAYVSLRYWHILLFSMVGWLDKATIRRPGGRATVDNVRPAS